MSQSPTKTTPPDQPPRKPIIVEPMNGSGDIAGLRFSSVRYDDTPFDMLLERSAHYRLYHPDLQHNYYVPLELDLNFFMAREKLDRLRMDKPRNADRLVGYATESMVYQQMLHYGCSGLGDYSREYDATDPSVQRFKVDLKTIVDESREICGAPVISELEAFIARRFQVKHDEKNPANNT